jgi:hypothetical protein
MSDAESYCHACGYNRDCDADKCPECGKSQADAAIYTTRRAISAIYILVIACILNELTWIVIYVDVLRFGKYGGFGQLQAALGGVLGICGVLFGAHAVLRLVHDRRSVRPRPVIHRKTTSVIAILFALSLLHVIFIVWVARLVM